jgi:hypothetical protein
MVRTRWTWVTCLAVLFAGQSHAHLHYCFDGQEPPVSVHFGDGIDPGHEHEEHHDEDDSPHDDLDVEINRGDQALAKVFKLDHPDLASFPGWSLIVAAPRISGTVASPEFPHGPDPPHVRPQVRGPPA